MIQLLLVAAATVVASEIVLRSPLRRSASDLAKFSRRAASVVRSAQISDHWKERVLPGYARRILVTSLGLLAWLAVVAAPILVVAMLVEGSFPTGTAWLMRPAPLFVMAGVAALWIWGRGRLLA